MKTTDSPTQEASDALDQIETIESETYLPPRGHDPFPKHIAALIIMGGICSLTASLWLFSHVSTWWSYLAGGLIVLLFVLAVSRLEKKKHNVQPKVVMPKHVQNSYFKQMWPMHICMVFGVIPLVWILEKKQPLIVIALVATCFILFTLTMTALTGKWRKSNTIR